MEHQALATFAGVFSLGTSFHSESSCHLLVKYSIGLPPVINTSCFSQGNLSTLTQTGGEEKCSTLLKHRPEKCGVLINEEERQLLRKITIQHFKKYSIYFLELDSFLREKSVL